MYSSDEEEMEMVVDHFMRLAERLAGPARAVASCSGGESCIVSLCWACYFYYLCRSHVILATNGESTNIFYSVSYTHLTLPTKIGV